MKSKTESSVTIGFQSSNLSGEVACIILNKYSQTEYGSTNAIKPSAEQIYLGVDAENADALKSKVVDAADDAGNAITEMTLDGLSAGTKYSSFCTATNGYLVFPGYVAINDKDAQQPMTFTTNGEQETDDSDDDSALLVSSNIVAISTMIAALIFN